MDTDTKSIQPSPPRGLTSKSLYKAIFDSEYPEQFVRSIPAQTLYIVMKERGIESSTDLIDIAPVSHIRLLLDFDLWEKDRLNEENFWDWLTLTDESDPLKFTQKLLKAIDLKIVSLLIGKYVQVKIFDDANDTPPGEGFYTPDKGFTWINVTVEDGTRHFLFNRLLALIFETSAELFYQLISIPTVSTESLLEDEAFTDRAKRLSAEGVPEFELTEAVNASLLPVDAKLLLETGAPREVVNDVRPIEPILYDSLSSLQPLNSVLSQVRDREECEAELTLILNASVQFFSIPFYDYEAVLKQVERVRGAINIGLERAATLTSRSHKDTYDILGLQKLYRIGLYELRVLRKAAHRLSYDELKELQQEESVKFSILAHARQDFPEMPEFLTSDGKITEVDGHLLKGSRSIAHISEIEAILRIFA